MGRGNEKTVFQTSIAEIFAKLIDKYIEQEQGKSFILHKKMSRSEVIGDAILLLLYQKGALEELLADFQVPASEVSSIKARLKAEYDVSPKDKP